MSRGRLRRRPLFDPLAAIDHALVSGLRTSRGVEALVRMFAGPSADSRPSPAESLSLPARGVLRALRRSQRAPARMVRIVPSSNSSLLRRPACGNGLTNCSKNGLLESYFTSHGVVIEWTDDVLGKSYEDELVEDILTLMASFSAKIYGKRSADRRREQREKEQAEWPRS